ncbi:transposase [Polynucleobacter sp. P1-05-14]|nr:transposase [Polynucleobacter sp. P1-05-14]
MEHFNRTVRYEWLSQYCWQNINGVRKFATQWTYKYNYQRSNLVLGSITPKQQLVMVA